MPFRDDLRERVNDFSIGIELIGKPEDLFTDIQYEKLMELIELITKKHSLRSIVGHDDIAPGRKTDPGPRFDWESLKRHFSSNNFRFAN